MIEQGSRPGAEEAPILLPERPPTPPPGNAAPATPGEADSLAATIRQHRIAERFPRPLAYSCSRLEEETRGGEPAAAAWALREAWETAVRFLACLGIADLVQAGAGGPGPVRALSSLIKWDGPSLEDWA